MSVIKKYIGLRIKELRIQKNITQEKLALLSCLDRTYLSNVENGKRNIAIVNLAKIASAFGMNIFDFFDSDYFRGVEDV